MRTISNPRRVLVLMPTTRDSYRTASLLKEEGISALTCGDLAQLCREVRIGTDAVLITDDCIFADTAGQLAETVRVQPTWSALPVIVIAREGATHHVQSTASDALSSLVVVERPVRTRSLMSVVRSALRNRRHQYQIRDAILEREAQASMLREQEERLRSTDRRKDEFLATLAHELRNPLAPIRTGMDLLRSEPPPAVAERTLAVMSRQVSHMVRLIDDLLDVSRITRGQLELKREHVTLDAVIDAAVEASLPQIEQAGHVLKVNVSEQDALFNVDATRIAQVVSNLLNNASKYSPAGKGVITLSATTAGDTAIIEVRDNGVGIPPNRLEDVFEMFHQVHPAQEGGQGGLGIGLALVRKLVEMHGGTVSGTSDGSGKGSVFEVRLPLAVERGATVASDLALPITAVMQRRRILVVDDNVDAAELLSLMLERAGYLTAIANDAQTAIATAASEVPSIVILDIGLPDGSGYDVARELRKIERLAPLGLIALTGWGTLEDKQKAMAAGFDFHLTKPIDARLLHTTLEDLEGRMLTGRTSLGATRPRCGES